MFSSNRNIVTSKKNQKREVTIMMAWLVMEREVCNLLDLMLNTGGLLKKGESLLLQNCTLKKGQILEKNSLLIKVQKLNSCQKH